MKTTDIIGLDAQQSKKTVASLQQLLADLQVYYTNLRGLHWNIKGSGFFTLHAQFEKMYNDVSEKADQVAERILMLGGTPENRFSGYLKTASLKEASGISSADGAIANILETLGMLTAQERGILRDASEAGDEATVALMSDYLSEQEKTVWMLTAYVSK